MKITYRFTKENGASAEFALEFDPTTLELIHAPQATYPEWTRLEHKQCPNCPLKSARSPLCPVARNLSPFVEPFKHTFSTEMVEVEIVTEHRTYRKKTAVQHAVSSLVGLIMSSSGCPILEKFKPMMRSHLPFATSEESVYRLLSMYLLAQYFIARKGGTPDWRMEKLSEHLKEISVVNTSFVRRLSSHQYKDAALNAITHLDCFANIASLNLEGHSIKELENLFSVFLNPAPK